MLDPTYYYTMIIDFGLESWPDKMAWGLVLGDYSELKVCPHVIQYYTSRQAWTFTS